MSDWPTDAMIDAAMATQWPDGNRPSRSSMGRALAAALGAAPTADGVVWCALRGWHDERGRLVTLDDASRHFVPCDGPTHRTLIVGPEVTP